MDSDNEDISGQALVVITMTCAARILEMNGLKQRLAELEKGSEVKSVQNI